MFKFHLLRGLRDWAGHLILIAVPVLLIAFFNYVFSGAQFRYGQGANPIAFLSALTIGFALTFQIYGASVSFEVIGDDFLSPKKDRLLASPAEPRAIVSSTIVVGFIVSFLQTLAVLLFASLALKAELGSIAVALPIFALSAAFNQLLGTAVLILCGSVKLANGIMTFYGAVAPMAMGLYFPLPHNGFFSFVREYLGPMALANTAILGAMEGNSFKLAVGVGALALLSLGLFLALPSLIRRLAR